jgi:hypothetical protein
MVVKPGHPWVDASGLVSTPFLQRWSFPSHTLVELAVQLADAFGREPPLYSKPAGGAGGGGGAQAHAHPAPTHAHAARTCSTHMRAQARTRRTRARAGGVDARRSSVQALRLEHPRRARKPVHMRT